MSTARFTLFIDLNTLGFGAEIAVPYSVRDLLEALPGSAADLLSWMPNITLNEVDFAFDPSVQRFTLGATAGIAGSANPSAGVFLDVLPKGAGPQTSYPLVVGFSLDTPIDLGGTPLFGSMLDGITLNGFALTYASEDIPDLPPGAGLKYNKGFALGLTLRAGGVEETFRLTPATKKKPTLLRAVEPAPEPPLVQWFPVQKKFGPLAIDRIGIATPPDRFGLALDASVTTTTLNLVLSGFTATFPKDEVSLAGLRVDLDALAVSFASGPVKLAGSLRKVIKPEYVEYAGGLVIRAGKFGITAIGAFGEVEGAISLFVFGLAEGPFGGPPAFFVTGIAAGFGYNRALKLPAPDRVQDYPLILAAKNGTAYLPNPNPAAALSKMSEGGFVPPRVGSYWLAAGVRFSSFQVLDSFVVLSVEFGRDLVIALLGIASLRLPKLGPTYAYAELTLSAVLRPLDGTLQVSAFLTPNSFVIDRNCRLGGGFAFWLWFGPHKRAGDFVVTLGGYNPHYRPPDWYPVPPRLGFSWDVSTTLSMSGGCYFALTPSCVMAGGSLSVRFRSGDLSAWFDANADFLIWWNPFWFDARVGVSIGARYTLSFLGISKTFSIELSANVELWGPPFAGKARVNWWIISFTITINGGQRPTQNRVLKDWDEFAQAYLPSGSDEVCRPTVVSGLAQILEFTKPNEKKETIWILATGALSLGFETLAPATRWAILGGDAVEFQGPEAGVYPLGSVQLQSMLTLELLPWGEAEPFDLTAWEWMPQVSNVPQSLWGLENDGRPQLAANVQPAMLSGVGAPNPPSLTGPPVASLKILSLTPLPTRNLPLPFIPPIDGSTAPVIVDSRAVIRDTVMASEVVSARDAIVAVLNEIGGGGLTGGDLSLLASDVYITLPGAPMLGPLGSTGPRPQQAPAAARGRAAPPAPSAPAVANADRSAAPHALRAVFHRAADTIGHWRDTPRARALAYVLDGFASPLERRLACTAAGRNGRARARLQRGMTVVWDVPLASSLRLAGVGTRPLRVATLDRFGALCGGQRLQGGGDVIAIPDRARRVVLSADDAGGRGAAGWLGSLPLLIAAPQALLGLDAIVRPQAPVLRQRVRREFEHRILSGRGMAVDNVIGDAPGWIETAFMSTVQSVVVVLRQEAESVPLGEVSVFINRTRAQPRGEDADDDRAFLFYAVPASEAPSRVLLQTPKGWRPDGVLGFPVDCDALRAGLFTPLSPVGSADVCEVEFQ